MTTTFARLSKGTLVFLLAVILWGSFVRASGSGAGCGNHWPLCNGVVIPVSGTWKTLVEFTHRASSGISLILCGLLCALSFRAFPKGSLLRKAGVAAFFFILMEALIGAALVLLKLVEHNESTLRAVSMAIHLVNTYLLLGAVALAVHWCRAGGASREFRREPRWTRPRGRELGYGLAALGLLAALGASGAVTALGDTLFPAQNFVQGIAQDLSPTRSFLISLRLYHPFIALSVSLYVILFARAALGWGKGRQNEREITLHAYLCVGLQCAQILLGFLNVLLLAPIWIQLSHLLMSDLVWINLVFLLSSLWVQAGVQARGEVGLDAGPDTKAATAVKV